MDLTEWIDRHAGLTPDKTAIRFPGRDVSYAGLAGLVDRLASALAASGLKPGGCAAYLGFNSPEMLATLFACARLGALFMPLNWRLAAPEHRQTLADCPPAVLFVEQPFVAQTEAFRSAFGTTSFVALGSAPQGWISQEDFLGRADGAAPRGAQSGAEAPLLICYTSGSTGKPKGVLLSRSALMWNAANSADMHGLTGEDRILTTLPLFHVGGLNIQTMPALHAGCTVVLHPRFDPEATFDAIERERITLTVLVPAQLDMMMAHPRWQSADFSSLRMITTGSTIVPERLTRAVHARGVPLVAVYGSTETCPIAAYLKAEEAERKAGSTGRTAAHCELRVVNDFDRDALQGTTGEIVVRGPNLFIGYWKAPEATAAVLRDGWFHTGDMGHLDDEGYLYVDGRKKDMIISGGENIYPAEIEHVLAECGDIAEASVIGRPDERWGEIVVAVVVPKAGSTLTAEEVLKLFEGRIARYKHPKEVVFVAQLPKTALGKVRKEDVRLLVRRESEVSAIPKPFHANDYGAHPMALKTERSGVSEQANACASGRYAETKTERSGVSEQADASASGHYTGTKIGIDVGGTFTDFVVTREGAEPAIFKTLSTPSDPSIAVVNGLTDIAAAMNPPLSLEAFASAIDTIVHGTTVTTNATLTSTGAKCGLLTTQGVRDALEMRRGIREEQYNNRYTNVKPLVPRYLRAGIAGRLDRKGVQTAPLDLDEVRQAVELFKREGVQAVSICFMNSFANPAHEQAAAELVRREMPAAYLSVSTDLLPSIRFYERVSTTALNSYVGPKLNHYLDQLVGRLKGIGFHGLLLIMQSNGGVISPQLAREKAALTLLSGPAGGPGAGLFYVRVHGQNKCITTDMGGTSFEASVAVDSPMIKNDGEIARHKIALPMLDIHTIGAGGGSIGWLDEGGMLRMGPQSAGADPGPACYGKGGRLPATTDANVVLGYLDPEFFAGGKMKLDVAAARRAIEEHIARPMGFSIEEAAAGMYRVACNNMAQGVREVTIKRGFDPREFPFIPAGGAGPIHSCLICQELDIPLQIVPRESSVLCAFGMLMSELKHDFVRTFVSRLETIEWARLTAIIDEMAHEGARQLTEERIVESRRRYDVKFDCRYIKQYHEVSFVVPRDLIDRRDATAIARAFHAEHNRLYGYSLEQENTPIEIINLRVQAIGLTDKPVYREEAWVGADAAQALKGRRSVYIPETKTFSEVPIYDGHRMRSGNRIEGPAMIEQETTAIFVSASYDCAVDALGSFALFQKGREDLVKSCIKNKKEALV